MPIKVYACLSCTKEFENVKVRSFDPDPTHCPHCGSKEFKPKDISTGTITKLKGKWYKDGY